MSTLGEVRWAVVLVLAFGPAAHAQDPPPATNPLQALKSLGLEFTGYLRAGTGGNSDGGRQLCTQLPGAPAKYRLGNECEIFGEIGLGGTAFRGDDGAQFDFHTMVSYGVPGQGAAESVTPSLAQAWVSGTRLLSGRLNSAMFWAGKRYYLRQDVHINDFFYWDSSGTGGGVQDIDLGLGKLSYAFFHDTNNELANNYTVVDIRGVSHDVTGATFLPNDRSVNRHDLRLSGIRTNTDGLLTVGGDLRTSDSNRAGFDGHGGFMVTGQHVQAQVLGGENHLVLQYGQGAAATLGKFSDDTAGASHQTFRALDRLSVSLGSDWSGMVAGVVERRESPDAGEGQTWYSIGARPVYHFTDHIAVAFEVGQDIVQPDDGAGRALTKITLAPMLTKGRGFSDRPQLRLFVTQAFWNQAARDAGLVGTGDANRSLSFGVQAEIWW